MRRIDVFQQWPDPLSVSAVHCHAAELQHLNELPQSFKPSLTRTPLTSRFPGGPFKPKRFVCARLTVLLSPARPGHPEKGTPKPALPRLGLRAQQLLWLSCTPPAQGFLQDLGELLEYFTLASMLTTLLLNVQFGWKVSGTKMTAGKIGACLQAPPIRDQALEHRFLGMKKQNALSSTSN